MGGSSAEVEILRNALGSIADEMAVTHMRAAYSSVVRQTLDFSTAVCDGEGRLVAQGLSLALQLGAIPRFMENLCAAVAEPREGDVYVLNHPWQGGVHLPDFFFARPVFSAEDATAPMAYAVIVSHMTDVGGPYPGSLSAAAPDIWSEGLIIPLSQLVNRGEVNETLMSIIEANTRQPDKVLGDVRAALASLETGARQVRLLAERYGENDLRTLFGEMLDATERATRAAIGSIPDGVGRAIDFLDDNGIGGDPVRFECELTKEGDRLRFDFTGTGLQTPSGINATIADARSVAIFAARAALHDDIALNHGFNRCIEVSAPIGCVVNANYPAGVSARATSIYRLADVALRAIAQLAPDRIPAGDGGPAVVYLSGVDELGETFIVLDYVQSGWGATSSADGVKGASHAMVNAANTPIEIAEQEAPVLIRKFELAADTAGQGKYHGSPAVRREYEATQSNLVINYRLERLTRPPSGVDGGGNGTTASCAMKRVKDETWTSLPGKGTIRLNAGDKLSIQLASGGGVGGLTKRDPALKAFDLASDLVSGGHNVH